jgi:hypothetical protein
LTGSKTTTTITKKKKMSFKRLISAKVISESGKEGEKGGRIGKLKSLLRGVCG